jgi:hypothetical protein
VLDDFGRAGRAWRETDEGDTGRATLIRHLLEGQYSCPIRVIAFNITGGWSRGVTEEIARELERACGDHGDTSPSIADFIAQFSGPTPVRP